MSSAAQTWSSPTMETIFLKALHPGRRVTAVTWVGGSLVAMVRGWFDMTTPTGRGPLNPLGCDNPT